MMLALFRAGVFVNPMGTKLYLSLAHDEESIGEFAGSPIDPSSVLNGSSFAIGQMHTSWGNPSRVGRTSITIRQDDAWRTELSRRDLVVLTLLNLPLLLRYGYPIRPSRPRRRTLRSRRLRRADLAHRRGSVT
jgi:hypothetical protein